MKILVTSCLWLLFAVAAQAQPKDAGQDDLQAAAKTFKGKIGKSTNFALFFAQLQSAANKGNSRAMYNLAECYAKGVGTGRNADSAKYWYLQAGGRNYAKAYYRLGLAYKKGFWAQPDFDSAYHYYALGADMGNANAIFNKGYMHYTGLGCKQDYAVAYGLFTRALKSKNPNAMRFVGLCMRNGYGTERNEDSAKYWLKQASLLGGGMADDELGTNYPENADSANIIKQRLQTLQQLAPPTVLVNSFNAVQHRLAPEDVEGAFAGWLLKYDWSGKYVVAIDKVNLQLAGSGQNLQGRWVENDSVQLPLKARLEQGQLLFEEMAYQKKGHYYRQLGEWLKFKKAALQTLVANDTTFVFGNLEMFSLKRNEPAKPMYLVLYKTNVVGKTGVDLRLSVYPNPFGQMLNVYFELGSECVVSAEIYGTDGKKLYANNAGKLAKGAYHLPLQPNITTSGVYLLTIKYGGKAHTVKIVKN